MTPTPGSAQDWAHVLAEIAATLDTLGAEGWIVGGCLRDALLGLPVWDVDVAVTADPRHVAKRIPTRDGQRGRVVPLAHGARTQRVALRTPGEPSGETQVDVSGLNGVSLLTDLAARDFTINALALPVRAWPAFVAVLAKAPTPHNGDDPFAGQLVDPLGGLRDLRDRRLRAASEHALLDDAIRVLRAVRFAVTLDLAPTAEAWRQARAAASGLTRVPVAAVAGELRLLMVHSSCARGIALLDDLNALRVVLPELAGDSAWAAHGRASLAAVERVPELVITAGERSGVAGFAEALRAWLDERVAPGRSRMATLRWAALLHHLRPRDAGAEDGSRLAGTAARRMGLGARERSVVAACAAHLMAAHALALTRGTDDAPARRYFAAVGEAGAEALMVAAACGLADEAAGEDARPALLAGVATLLSHYVNDRARLIPPPLVSGRELMAGSGRAPGPWVGEVLARVRSAQIEGEVVSHGEALRLARRLAAERTRDGGASE